MSREAIFLLLLKKEVGYYKAILDLTKQEGEVISHKRPLSDLQSIIKKKQVLFSCVEEIESALQPIHRSWQNKKEHADSDSKKVKLQISDLQKLIQQILELDQANQKRLRGRMVK